MYVFADWIIFFVILIFGVVLILLGVLSKQGAIGILTGDAKAQNVLIGIGTAFLAATLALVLAKIFITGPKSNVFTWLSNRVNDIFSGDSPIKFFSD